MRTNDIKSIFFFVVTWQTCFAFAMGVSASFTGTSISGAQSEVVYGWLAFMLIAGMATAGGVWLALVFAAFMWLFSKR